MPSPLAHSAMGYLLLSRDQKRELLARWDWKPLVIFVLFANLPDFDLLPGLLVGDPGRFHHGKWIAHSLGAGFMVAGALWLALALCGRRDARRWSLACLILYTSHIVLDFFSADPGLPFGQMIFWPISHDYFLSPISVFSNIQRGSPGVMLGMHNLLAILWEAALVIPLLVLASWQPARAAWASRSGRQRRPQP